MKKAQFLLLILLINFQNKIFGEDIIYPVDPVEVARIQSDELYTRLALERTTDLANIKKSYRYLVRRYHPDSVRCNPNHKDGLLFMKVDEAYKVLSDVNLRVDYDGSYSRLFNSTFSSQNEKTYTAKKRQQAADVDDEIAEKKILLNLKSKYPELSVYIDGVIEKYLDPVIFADGLRVHNRIPILWPSDIALAWIIVKEGTFWLQWHLLYSLLTVPLWGQSNDLLNALLAKDNRRLNEFISEFMYYPHSINPERAKILRYLLTKGMASEVITSLALGGATFTAFTESPNPKLLRGPTPVLMLKGPSSKLKKKKTRLSTKKIKKLPASRLKGWFDVPEGVEVLEDIILNYLPRGDDLKAILYRSDLGLQLPHEVERLLRNYPEWMRALKLSHLTYIDLVEVQEILLRRQKTSICEEPVLILQ